jgi:hypothetical protein
MYVCESTIRALRSSLVVVGLFVVARLLRLWAVGTPVRTITVQNTTETWPAAAACACVVCGVEIGESSRIWGHGHGSVLMCVVESYQPHPAPPELMLLSKI